MRDIENAIQVEADQIADKRYMTEFCDLPKPIQFQVWCEAENIVKEKLAEYAEMQMEERRLRDAEIKIRDKKNVEVGYPSGRRVRYHYNHLVSEMQPPLTLPPKGPEE